MLLNADERHHSASSRLAPSARGSLLAVRRTCSAKGWNHARGQRRAAAVHYDAGPARHLLSPDQFAWDCSQSLHPKTAFVSTE